MRSEKELGSEDFEFRSEKSEKWYRNVIRKKPFALLNSHFSIAGSLRFFNLFNDRCEDSDQLIGFVKQRGELIFRDNFGGD